VLLSRKVFEATLLYTIIVDNDDKMGYALDLFRLEKLKFILPDHLFFGLY